MKKYTYLAIIFLGLISSCSDNNAFLPTIENPNKEWSLSYRSTRSTPSTTITDPISIKKEEIAGINGEKLLKVTQIIQTKAVCEMANGFSVSITNLGKNIELNYSDLSPGTAPVTADEKTTKFEHYFVIQQRGNGNGSNIPVQAKYTFFHLGYGTTFSEPFTLTF